MAETAIVMNPAGRRDAPWTAEQDAILSDAALTAARASITAWPDYAPTPLFPLPALARELGVAAIDYKDEAGRFGLGSFKALGGAYAVARLVQKRLGERLDREVAMEQIAAARHPEAAELTVCCATDGNHGRSVAWGAQRFGCRCVIFVHATVSEGRCDAIRRLGAEVRRTHGNYDDSVREADATAAREGWVVVSDTSYPGYTEIPRDVMQGYELMAVEAFEQAAAPPTHIFVQTGVGGMGAAVAALAKRRWGADRPWIVLADPSRAACWVESFRAGAPTAVHGDLDTMMAGLACGECSVLAWEILRDHADAAIAVPDDEAVAFMRRLADPEPPDPPLVAGESAVAGLGALHMALADPEARRTLVLDTHARILVFGTEGETDPALYRDVVGRTAADIRSVSHR